MHTVSSCFFSNRHSSQYQGLHSQTDQIHEDQKHLDVRVTILERNYQFTNQRDFEEQVKDVVIAEASSLIENEAKNIRADLRDQNLRRNRIIVTGFPESSDDHAQFAKLAEDLSITNYQIRTMFRLNPKPGTNPPRLLNIAFLSEKDKFQFLSRKFQTS